MRVLTDRGQLVVAVMDGNRRVKLGIRHASGKEKAGDWEVGAATNDGIIIVIVKVEVIVIVIVIVK